MSETLYEGENAQNNASRKTLTMNDMSAGSNDYISLKVGEEAELVVDRIEQVPESDPNYRLSKRDFKIEITNVEEVIQDIKGGLQSGISYCGGHSIEEARENAEMMRITGNAVLKSGRHGSNKAR